MQNKIQKFIEEHHQALRLAGVAVVVYFLYKHFFPQASVQSPPQKEACSCNCSQLIPPQVHYQVWTPPTVTDLLVQKNATEMN